jgi:hypothetical protein
MSLLRRKILSASAPLCCPNSHTNDQVSTHFQFVLDSIADPALIDILYRLFISVSYSRDVRNMELSDIAGRNMRT